MEMKMSEMPGTGNFYETDYILFPVETIIYSKYGNRKIVSMKIEKFGTEYGSCIAVTFDNDIGVSIIQDGMGVYASRQKHPKKDTPVEKIIRKIQEAVYNHERIFAWRFGQKRDCTGRFSDCVVI